MALGSNRKPGASGSVMSDPILLRRIAGNLVSNAIKYTQRGGVLLATRPRGSGRVLEVWDTGPGIPPDLLERVFDRFFRVPGTSADGSGLGLAITRAAALRQGLRVELLARSDGVSGLVARVHLAPTASFAASSALTRR